MACNGVAVLTAQVNLAEELQQVDEALLKSLLPRGAVVCLRGNTLTAVLARLYERIEIQNGRVHVEAGSRERVEELKALTELAAGISFQKRVVTWLQDKSVPVTHAQETADKTIVLMIRLNGRRARIAAAINGDLVIVTEEGDYESGSKDVLGLIDQLRASGITFNSVGAVEQHRHDHTPAHIHTRSKAKVTH